MNTVDDSNTVNIVNTDRTIKAVSIRNANEYNTICTIDNDGDMVLHGSITASNAYITVADVPLTDVGATLESLDGSVTTLEEQVAALAKALTDAGILASAAFGSSLAYTLASTVILGSSVVYKDTNAPLQTLTLKGQSTYVNEQTILSLNASYPNNIIYRVISN